jgi:hypothetical protein
MLNLRSEKDGCTTQIRTDLRAVFPTHPGHLLQTFLRNPRTSKPSSIGAKSATIRLVQERE